ncbi:MAG: MotA/TolQ/ExbB proton channel family protein [Chthoniobacterales bacterium]|nr:MotA/TolQ/ExbB proton channel family protein [Chthoniobacterales bacterium]
MNLSSQLNHLLTNSLQNMSTGSFIDVLMAGGWVMLPLGILSIVTLALILVYLITLRSSAMVTSSYMRMAEAFLIKGDLPGFLGASDRHREVIARIMSCTIDFLTRHPEATINEIRELTQAEGASEASILHQRVTWLSDIATISPMLGLLGTVFGMIRSFNVMANDVAATRPMLLAEGVAQALVATASGLVIGIAAMAAYAFFRTRVQAMISDLESATTQLLALLSHRK